MSDLVLTHGYFLAEDEKERQIMKPYPPLGLMYLAAYLRRCGLNVELFDTTFKLRETLYGRLRRDPPGFLGIYTTLLTRASVLDIVACARENRWRVILGGPESANHPEEYLARGAEVIVFGEGEQTLEQLLPLLDKRGPHRLHGVQGIMFRDEEGRPVRTSERPLPRNLDAYPWPDREALDIEEYLNAWRRRHGYASLNMITARGCSYRCTWCSHSVFGHSHRRRSPGDCARELAHIRSRYGPERLWYADDVFTISHPWLFEYARALRRLDIRMPFETISRADRMLKPEVLDVLAQMGCHRIWIGSESGSQRLLDAMRRGVTTEQVRWVTREAQRRGIQVGMFLMWGYGDEGIDDIAATVDHVTVCNPDIFFTTLAYPIKNTDYYRQYREHILPPPDWGSATDRDNRTDCRRGERFYRYADLWLRQSVAAARLAASDPVAARRKARHAGRAERLLRRQAELEDA